jgi:hypothetical protein
LPTDKISYRIKREQIREARQERIDEFLDEWLFAKINVWLL